MNSDIILLIAFGTLFMMLLFLILGIILANQEIDMVFLTITRYVLNLGSFLVLPAIIFIPALNNLLWTLSLYSVFILMCIRPLHNLFPKIGFSHLMPLRKNLGIFSAIIVISFGAVHYMGLGSGFFAQYFSAANWSFSNNLFGGI